MRRKLILDVDTGSDDAVAVMVAALSPCLELIALCTVWGNLPVEQTTFNTLAVIEAVGKKVPVYAGAKTAMVKYLTPGRSDEQRDYKPIEKDGKTLRIHDEKLAGIPDPKGSAKRLPAPLFYVEYLLAATEPVTIVAVGPLTNIALALRMEPSITKNIAEIIIMGGGFNTANSTLCSEANIWHDPEAAHIVTHCGASVLMVPLDATHAASLTLEDCEQLEDIGTFAGNFAANLTRDRIVYENELFSSKRNKTAIHDALAVCAAIDSDVLENVRPVHCKIGFEDYGEGAVLIDCRRKPNKSNIRFAYGANHDRFIALLCEIFQRRV